jgi:hypothetical protein
LITSPNRDTRRTLTNGVLEVVSDHQQLVLIDANNDGEFEVQNAKSFIASESGEDDDMGKILNTIKCYTILQRLVKGELED